ncbi:M15 family metallopeptidase [Nocardia otitidiscaviarum]|uniref:M15 family metallopeptidase n=1 Tax=Nocardia otitidiscaviarum TaxID=1823 RepID=UPI0007C78A9F|nr:M15 family metallopeptidase [Nocardia otitidiscaviarum]
MSFRTVYGYTHSENGWRMCNRDECVVALPALGIPYTDTAPVRSGDAATILGAWLIWYHRNVEPLSSPVWGWSPTNDVPNSNHLSGTAVDINAPKYPWQRYTMPSQLITRVRRGLESFEGTVFWGRDWSRPDEMHYQLGYPEGDRRIHAFAARLNGGHLGIYATTPQETDMALTSHQAGQLDDIQTQLRGPGLKGWPQLGKNSAGQNLTLVDAVAALRAEVAELRAALAARQAPPPQ